MEMCEIPNPVSKSENPKIVKRGQSSFNTLSREMPTKYCILKKRLSIWFSELDQEGGAAINQVITLRAKDTSSTLPGLFINAVWIALTLQMSNKGEK